jgi:hypothetical protein
MVVQVHLQTADVDQPHAAGLELPHLGNRCLPRREIHAAALGVDGPGPGADAAGRGVAAARFDAADRLQQAGGNAGLALGQGYGRLAGRTGGGIRRRRHRR